MTLGFLSGSKNFCKLLCVSCEVFVLHGYDWIHSVAKSCTTIAYWWLFRDSQFSLKTLWSAVFKSPKFSAQGTAAPLRILHRAPCNFGPLTDLAISVFREMSTNTVLTKNLHVSWIWALKTLHEKDWRESLPCSGISSSTKIFSEFLQPLRDVRTQRRSTWVGKQRVSPFYHLFNIWTWHRHRRGINSTLILSFSNLAVAWCCHSWWRRRAWGICSMMTLLSWRCHWGWWRSRGRTW